MNTPLALFLVALVSVAGNRLVSVLFGLILNIQWFWLLPTLFLLDVVQIPFYYWLFSNGSSLINRLPPPLRNWLQMDWNTSLFGRWTSSLGGLGVTLVAALPTFGGGIWSAVFLAYNLRLPKRRSYLLIGTGSLISFAALIWVLGTLVSAFRYFSSR